MRLYASLSKVRYLDKNYSFKYLFIAFLGVHIPLIGIIMFIVLSGLTSFTPHTVITSTLIFTLIACGITLFMQNALSEPIVATRNALADYLSNKVLPKLPVDFKDEVGQLMSNTSVAINELDGLIKEKRDFIYLLTHDLKTPLHNMMTIAHLMQEDDDNSSKAEHLQLIKQSAQHQLQLITTVLKLASSEFADVASLQVIPLAPVVERIANDLSVSTKNKQLDVLIDIPQDLKIKVNEDLITMAISNLLTNAIKFSNRKSEIMVRAAIMKDHIMIRVIDYGVGFAAGRGPTFEPFTKAGRTGTDGEASSGLGLYFTRKIISHHGGTLTAESEGDGKGAKMILKLPLA